MAITKIPYPYPGLRPFKRDEASIFFGRQEQSTQILEKLKTNKFLAVLGASGSGKSSLIKAGVLPSLAKGYMGELGTNWRIAEMRPGSYPFYNLAKALQFGEDDENQQNTIDPSIVSAELRQRSNSLNLFFDRSDFESDARMLILVDQFEELFRYQQQDSNLAAAFVALILEAAKHKRIYVVITMRSDFLGNAGVFLGLPEAINKGMYLTPRLDRQQLHDAICLPARLYNGEVDPVLANHIINEAANSPDHLPLLQHALRRLWVEDDNKILTFAEYQNTGGLHSVLNGHLDSIYKNFSDEERYIAKRMFALITERNPEGKYIRRAVKINEILEITDSSKEHVFNVINTFRKEGHNFLMPSTRVDLHPDLIIDITHESLIRQWNRLGRWINQEAENSTQYKSILEKSKRHINRKGDLLSGIDLQQARHWINKYKPNEKWASRYGGSFEQTRNYFDASLVEHREKKKKRLFRILGIGLFSSVLIGSFVGYVYNSELRQAARQAEEQKNATAAAALAREEDLKQEAALRKLALEAEQAKTTQAVEERKFAEALAREEDLKQDAALRKLALVAERAKTKQAVEERKVAAAMAREAYFKQEATLRKLALVAEQAKTKHLKLEATQRKLELEAEQAKVREAQEQKKIADALEKIKQDAIQTRIKQKNRLGVEALTLVSAFNSQESRYLSARSQFDKIKDNFDLSTLDSEDIIRLSLLRAQINANSRAPLTYKNSPLPIHDVVFDKKRKLILAAGEEGKLFLYEAGQSSPNMIETGLTKSIQDIDYHPNGDYFITAGANARIILWQWKGDEEIPTKIESIQTRGAIKGIAFSKDGKTIATGHVGPSNNVPINIWSLEADNKIQFQKRLRINRQVSEGGLLFLDDGRLASVSHGGKLSIWNLEKTVPDKVIKFQGNFALGIDLSSDGKRLAVSDNRKVSILDTSSFTVISTFPSSHDTTITSLKWITDEKGNEHLVSGDFNGEVYIWDVEQGVILLSLAGHESGLGASGMAFDDINQILYTPDGTGIAEWSTLNQAQQIIPIGTSKPRPVGFSSDRNHILFGTDDGYLKVLNASSNLITNSVKIADSRVTNIAVQPNGGLIAVASRDKNPKGRTIGKLGFYQINQNGKLHTQRNQIDFERRLESLAFNSDGTLLYTSGLDGRIGVLDMSSDLFNVKLSHPLNSNGNDLQIRSVDISQDGKYLLTSKKREVQLWRIGADNLPEFPALSTIESTADLHKALFSINPKNKFGLFTVGRVGRVLHYPIDDNGKINSKKRTKFFGHKNTVFDANILPEANMLLTLSADATIRGWGASTDSLIFGSPLFTLKIPSHIGYPPPFYDFDHYCTTTKCRFAVPLRRKGNAKEKHLIVYDFNLNL